LDHIKHDVHGYRVRPQFALDPHISNTRPPPPPPTPLSLSLSHSPQSTSSPSPPLANRIRDPRERWLSYLISALLVFGEFILGLLILLVVPYTEIDWETYMSQAGAFLSGERNYHNIGGATGPCVYPAGHIYTYAALHRATDGGDIPKGQQIFLGLYLVSLALVLHLYAKAEAFEPWSLVVLALSRRLHSIYLLRLFNDGWAMLLAHAATALLAHRRLVPSILLFSLAVSVKMNVLLMAPAVLLLVLQTGSLWQLLLGGALGVAAQVALGWPFLSAYPREYLTRAFEFSRVFLYKWTVNLRFLPEPLFLSKGLASGLLACHVILLLLFTLTRWCRPLPRPAALLRAFLFPTKAHDDANLEKKKSKGKDGNNGKSKKEEGDKKEEKEGAAAAVAAGYWRRADDATWTRHVLTTVRALLFSLSIGYFLPYIFLFVCIFLQWSSHSLRFSFPPSSSKHPTGLDVQPAGPAVRALAPLPVLLVVRVDAALPLAARGAAPAAAGAATDPDRHRV
jgi:hypothetical protein